MPVIKGTHSKPGSVTAATGGLGGLAINNPNHSFRYLTLDLSAGAPAVDVNALLPADDPAKVIKALLALADKMFEQSDLATPKSTIPPVYTYWGQFIDHDITAGTDRDSNQKPNLLESNILDTSFAPQPHKEVELKIVNLRLPELDLDSVYGSEQGPNDAEVADEGIFAADNVHLRVGEVSPGNAPPAPAGTTRDLPRRRKGEPGVADTRVGEARIGDGRNDENVIIAQFHTAFLHFHNAVVDMLQANPQIASHSILAGLTPFEQARQIVRWTYQWLVVEDYLKTFAKPQVVDDMLNAPTSFFPQASERFMPLEYSVAGFRFGHTMVRAAYDYNMNFTMHNPQIANASLVQLFRFTHAGNFTPGKQNPADPRTDRLPGIWVIDWERFTNKHSTVDEQFARKIDTNLALPLQALDTVDEVAAGQGVQGIVRNLARRNLLRGYLFNLPTGQHVAQSLGVPVLANVAPTGKSELKTVLEESGFDKRTPLWYYILREAETDSNGQGNRLGETGSRLVAGTIISMLKSDAGSYINKGWTPTHTAAAKLHNEQPIQTIMDLFRFAGVAP